MATALVSNITLGATEDAQIWKGGSRLVYGLATGEGTPPAFPAKIEDVCAVAGATPTYALLTGFLDFGATTEDGITIGREWDTDEGITIDQRDSNLRAGGTTNTRMTVTGTGLNTSSARLRIMWGLGTMTPVAVVPTTVTAQLVSGIGASQSNPERILCVLQQNDVSGKIRMFAFRKAKIASAGDLGVQSRTTTTQEFTFNVNPDSAITDGSEFGKLFEQT